MKTNKKVCKTVFLKNSVESNEALSIYSILEETIRWEYGIKTKKSGFTRKAKSIDPKGHPLLMNLVNTCIDKMTDTKYMILGIYLNYYKDGTMYTPNHAHKGTDQLAISLGATRILNVGKKSYNMENGDAILFGGSTHGVPKDTTVLGGRISIATFMVPLL